MFNEEIYIPGLLHKVGSLVGEQQKPADFGDYRGLIHRRPSFWLTLFMWSSVATCEGRRGNVTIYMYWWHSYHLNDALSAHRFRALVKLGQRVGWERKEKVLRLKDNDVVVKALRDVSRIWQPH
jgi:hypothetical protein